MSYQQLNQSDQDDPTLPYNIFKPENIAIIMAYFSVGLTGSLLSTPLNVYLVEVLNAEPQMQNTIGILQTLPWSLKLAFGFLSDACPINGMHRKPYLAIGSLLYSSSFIIYALLEHHNVEFLAICIFMGTIGLIQMDVMADTMCVQRSKFEPEETKGQMQASCYSIRFAGSLLGAIMGATLCNRETWGWGLTYLQVSFINGLIPFIFVTPWLFTLKERFKSPKPSSVIHPANASVDGLELGVVEMNKGREEVDQQTALGSKKISNSISNNTSKDSTKAEQTSLLGRNNNNQLTNKQSANNLTDKGNNSGYGALPTSQQQQKAAVNSGEDTPATATTTTSGTLPTQDILYLEQEAANADPTQTIYDQLQEIWLTVQLQSVWRPMTFVYIFNLFQVPNVAWQSYLQLCLKFPAWILGATVMLGSFMTFAGVLGYKYFFFKSSWRSIYIWTVLLTAFFSLCQLCLIFQWNVKYLHLSNYFFAMGDDVISAYISGIQFLPLCIMYMRLCPEGAEGSSYAMLTTFGNIALVCASNLGNMLANVWDVSNAAMREQNVEGLWKLNTFTSLLAILPLSLLFLLPKDAEEQDILAKSQVRSKTAGAVFLVVLFGSLTWTTVTAIMRVTASEGGL